MADYELIKRVCDLTCSKEELEKKSDTIEYDTEYPFKKYYNVEAIIGAFNKCISHEWDELTLSNWAYIYMKILCGGFDDNLKEDLNSLENFLKDTITWDLDSLSFFDESMLENGIQDLYDWIESLKVMDHVWQTRKNFKAVYGIVGDYAKDNGGQYVVLISDATKEYMIIRSNYLDNVFEDEYFKYVSEKEFIKLIEQLKEKQYTILSWSEEWYYDEISE